MISEQGGKHAPATRLCVQSLLYTTDVWMSCVGSFSFWHDSIQQLEVAQDSKIMHIFSKEDRGMCVLHAQSWTLFCHLSHMDCSPFQSGRSQFSTASPTSLREKDSNRLERIASILVGIGRRHSSSPVFRTLTHILEECRLPHISYTQTMRQLLYDALVLYLVIERPTLIMQPHQSDLQVSPIVQQSREIVPDIRAGDNTVEMVWARSIRSTILLRCHAVEWPVGVND